MALGEELGSCVKIAETVESHIAVGRSHACSATLGKRALGMRAEGQFWGADDDDAIATGSAAASKLEAVEGTLYAGWAPRRSEAPGLVDVKLEGAS